MSEIENSSEAPLAQASAWSAIRVVPSDAALRDSVIDALFEIGSQGIHEDGDAVVTHFPPDSDIEAVRSKILEVDAVADFTVSVTPEVSWELWRASVGAHKLGALTVAPPWLAEELDPATTIVIDPEMAFGTGEHPTTRGVVRLMQSVVRPGDVVADLGAGSAVLAIAAAKLNAGRVAAIELDPDATSNAIENISRNGVDSVVQYIEGDASLLLPLLAPVNIVLANIISSVLLEILPVIYSSIESGGHAILSGILYEEREKMLAAINSSGWEVKGEDSEGEWWSVLLQRA